MVCTYFLAPVLSEKLLAIPYGETTLAEPLTLALGTGVINSFIFTLVFLIFYAFIVMICNIVKHCLIKSLREKSENKAKMKRAKSINPKAERMARRAEWKSLKAEYGSKNRWWKRVLSMLMGIVVAATVSVITLLPYGYVAERLNSKGDKDYLEKGYDYTLNGVIDNKFEDFFDWALNVKEESKPEVEAPEVETPETETETEGGAEA